MTRLLIGKPGIYLLSAVAVAAAVWLYGASQYHSGVRDTTSEFIEADREGAENVRTTAGRVLRDLGSVDDPDELLRSTGGLRDE